MRCKRASLSPKPRRNNSGVLKRSCFLYSRLFENEKVGRGGGARSEMAIVGQEQKKRKIWARLGGGGGRTLFTCLPGLHLPVYPSLIYLFTHARSTCLPKPGQLVYPGLVNLFTQSWFTTEPCIFVLSIETSSKTCILRRFRHLRGPQGSRLSPLEPH